MHRTQPQTFETTIENNYDQVKAILIPRLNQSGRNKTAHLIEIYAVYSK